MSPRARRGRPPWVIITGYPRWPSPYFTCLHRHAPAPLALAFRPALDDLETASVPGVINLHRLKRLYRDPVTGAPAPDAAAALAARLASLRAQGWRVVWTVHNLLPIDGQFPGRADRDVAATVLSLADMVLCHTRADAAALRRRTRAEIRVTGWAGLEPPRRPPAPEIAALAARMRSAPVSFLLAGHLTAYKDATGTVAAFLASTTSACLTVAGDGADARTAARLADLAAASGSRVSVRPGRFAPAQAGHLYAAAHVAVCPYRTDGPFRFLAEMLYPSSACTAAGFGVPVVAPALPAISEITSGQRRWLAPPGGGLGPAMAAAETHTQAAIRAGGDPRSRRTVGDTASRWQHIAGVYQQAAADLQLQNPYPTAQGDSSRA